MRAAEGTFRLERRLWHVVSVLTACVKAQSMLQLRGLGAMRKL